MIWEWEIIKDYILFFISCNALFDKFSSHINWRFVQKIKDCIKVQLFPFPKHWHYTHM